MIVSNGLSVFVCVWSDNSARTAHVYKHRYHHFWASAGKLISRVGFLGIPKLQIVFDFTVPGSVSRIRKILDFSRFSQKVSARSWDAFCGFVCFRTSKISGYFPELNKSSVEGYKSPGCFAALRRYPCLRVQSSLTLYHLPVVDIPMTLYTVM